MLSNASVLWQWNMPMFGTRWPSERSRWAWSWRTMWFSFPSSKRNSLAWSMLLFALAPCVSTEPVQCPKTRPSPTMSGSIRTRCSSLERVIISTALHSRRVRHELDRCWAHTSPIHRDALMLICSPGALLRHWSNKFKRNRAISGPLISCRIICFQHHRLCSRSGWILRWCIREIKWRIWITSTPSRNKRTDLCRATGSYMQ